MAFLAIHRPVFKHRIFALQGREKQSADSSSDRSPQSSTPLQIFSLPIQVIDGHLKSVASSQHSEFHWSHLSNDDKRKRQFRGPHDDFGSFGRQAPFLHLELVVRLHGREWHIREFSSDPSWQSFLLSQTFPFAIHWPF